VSFDIEKEGIFHLFKTSQPPKSGGPRRDLEDIKGVDDHGTPQEWGADGQECSPSTIIGPAVQRKYIYKGGFQFEIDIMKETKRYSRINSTCHCLAEHRHLPDVPVQLPWGTLIEEEGTFCAAFVKDRDDLIRLTLDLK